MTKPIDHQRCSELLGAYVAEELSEPDRASVESHLTSCSECEQERVALAALAAGDIEPLDGDERTRLRERVEAALAPARGDVIGIEQRGRQARWGQVVGIAASVVLLVAGLFYVGTQGAGEGEDDTATGLSEEEAPAVEDAEPDRQRATTTSEGRMLGTEGEATQTDAESADSAFGAAGGALTPGPLFDARAGRVTERDLTRLGRRGDPFVSYVATYTVSDALNSRDAFLDDLVVEAPDSATGDDIRACSERVFSGAVDAILPAYGALGRLNQQEALILGYAWSDRSEGPLYRWMFWAWSPGDCDGLNRLYQTGRIRR